MSRKLVSIHQSRVLKATSCGREKSGGPGDLRTAHQVDPRADAHLFALLHHLQSFVEQHFSSKRVVYDFDVAVGRRESSSRGVFFHADSAPERKFEDDAASKSVRNVIVPEGKVALQLH